MAASTAVIALALIACRDAQPQPHATTSPSAPSSATPSQSAAPTSATPTVFGRLTVRFVKTTSASVVPRQPITYRLGVMKSGSATFNNYPMGSDGEFALALEPGTYEVAYLEIDAKDLSEIPIHVPLTATENLQLRAPATGCIYGGHVDVLYGRLVAGDQPRQAEIVQKLAAANKQNHAFIYLPNGGLIITGARIDIPAAADRPEAARNCVVEEFASVPA